MSEAKEGGKPQGEVGETPSPGRDDKGPPRRPRGGPRAPRGPPTCYNCGEAGHFARDCPNPPAEEQEGRRIINKARQQGRRCFNCGRMGHISAECKKPAGNKACYNCGQEGHIAKDCPNPKAE